MPAWGILQIHDEKNTTYIIARFDSVLQGISAQNYTTARDKVLLEMSLEGALTCSLPTEQVRLIERGRYDDAKASSTEPRGLAVLTVRLF